MRHLPLSSVRLQALRRPVLPQRRRQRIAPRSAARDPGHPCHIRAALTRHVTAGPSSAGLYVPNMNLVFPEMRHGGAETTATGFDEHRPMTPPPDLPSLMLDSRIIYLGMPVIPPPHLLSKEKPCGCVQLVSAVTELIVAELIYLQYKDATKPVYLYINSSGTTRADGEVVGFETEGMAIYDTMQYVKNEARHLHHRCHCTASDACTRSSQRVWALPLDKRVCCSLPV